MNSRKDENKLKRVQGHAQTFNKIKLASENVIKTGFKLIILATFLRIIIIVEQFS